MTVAALHGSRLAMMLTQTIDTTVRGIVYEAAGSVDAARARRGASVWSARRRRVVDPELCSERATARRARHAGIGGARAGAGCQRAFGSGVG